MFGNLFRNQNNPQVPQNQGGGMSPTGNMPNPQQPMPIQYQQNTMPWMMNQYMNQARPQALQPEGWRDAAGNAQMNLLDEYQNQGGYENTANKEMRRFQEQILPQLARGFGGRQGSAYGSAAKDAALDLSERLGSIGEQNRMQRLSGLQNFLQQNQQAGLQHQQIGQQGIMGIANNALGLGQLLSNDRSGRISGLRQGAGQQASIGAGQGQGQGSDDGIAGAVLSGLQKLLGM